MNRSTDTIIVEYRSAWPTQFAQVAAELRSVFASEPVGIEHIGSTSVPGLCAKPVLDILVGVASLKAIEPLIPEMTRSGYTYRSEYEGEIPERRYFVRSSGELPRIHVHGVVRDDRLWVDHMRFRDMLRRDPVLMESYGALKRDLAAYHASDKAAYCRAKAPFILNLLSHATDFDSLYAKWRWRPIPNCPGRFTFDGGLSRLRINDLIGMETTILTYDVPSARDSVLVAALDEGGLISYRSTSGCFMHTLNTASGLSRKLANLGIA